MNCGILHTKIIFFLDGSLPEKEIEEVNQHLSGCSECAAFASEMKKNLAILENNKLTEVNPYFYTRVKAKLIKQPNKQASESQNPVPVRILKPLVFSLLLLAGIYAGIKIGKPVFANSAILSQTEAELIPFLNEMETETIETFLMD